MRKSLGLHSTCLLWRWGIIVIKRCRLAYCYDNECDKLVVIGDEILTQGDEGEKSKCKPSLVFSGREYFLWCSLCALPDKINQLVICVTIWYTCVSFWMSLKHIQLVFQTNHNELISRAYFCKSLVIGCCSFRADWWWHQVFLIESTAVNIFDETLINVACVPCR